MSIKPLLMLSRLAGWMAVAVIAILSLVPGRARPHVLASSHAEHLAAYFIAAALLTLGYPLRRDAAMIAMLLPIYAALLELLQLWVPDRMARPNDVVAGTLGAWSGIACAMLTRWLAGRST